ncbi:MAG: hypothetical protein ACTHXA_06745 [Gulosibacter sp.]|uniref:hypothetical protein n=1 Tax=Gulosibacter sp. TaxID=2817531 RepID=UPI003F9153F7
MTVLIDVFLGACFSACVGDRPQIGDTVDWEIIALDPATTPANAHPRFIEEHDGIYPPGVPVGQVRGRVTRVLGVQYRREPAVGSPGSLQVAGADVFDLDPDYVYQAGDELAFGVTLEVSAQSELPEFRDYDSPDPARARREAVGMADAVGAQLAELSERVRSQFGQIADIQIADGGRAVSVRPFADRASEVHWERTGLDSAGISIHAGEGHWYVADTVESVSALSAFVDAIAAGNIVELLRGKGTPRMLFVTEVVADGRAWTHERPGPTFNEKDGTLTTASYRPIDADRMSKLWGAGKDPYRPWR